jgi:hypothetical protein
MRIVYYGDANAKRSITGTTATATATSHAKQISVPMIQIRKHGPEP